MAEAPSQPDAGRRKKRSRVRWELQIPAIVLLIAAGYFLARQPGNRSSFYGQRIGPARAAYNFELTDDNGHPLRLSDLKGKVVLISFGFTHCPNICPTTLTSLNKVYELLPAADREKVQVVFISVDPGRDTPAQLKQYVPFFNPAFVGATTSVEGVKKIAREYGAFFEYVPHLTDDAKDNYTVTHSAYTYLIDPEGRLAVIYNYEQLGGAARIAGDIGKILHP